MGSSSKDNLSPSTYRELCWGRMFPNSLHLSKRAAWAAGRRRLCNPLGRVCPCWGELVAGAAPLPGALGSRVGCRGALLPDSGQFVEGSWPVCCSHGLLDDFGQSLTFPLQLLLCEVAMTPPASNGGLCGWRLLTEGSGGVWYYQQFVIIILLFLTILFKIIPVVQCVVLSSVAWSQASVPWQNCFPLLQVMIYSFCHKCVGHGWGGMAWLRSPAPSCHGWMVHPSHQ